jgi:hypothetical protein
MSPREKNSLYRVSPREKNGFYRVSSREKCLHRMSSRENNGLYRMSSREKLLQVYTVTRSPELACEFCARDSDTFWMISPTLLMASYMNHKTFTSSFRMKTDRAWYVIASRNGNNK